nr:CZB domain-containing protein [uncultured Rhodoferax sp.]
MGFFSRLFSLGNKDTDKAANVASTGAVTELGLDAQASAAILSEIDIDTAIAAHENWKLRLQNYLNGNSTETLQPEIVCLDDRCDLGKWLHGPGTQRLGKYPAFSVLIARHKYFHVQASNVVALAQTNQKDKATQALEGSYRYASNQVVLLLKELKRGLGR